MRSTETKIDTVEDARYFAKRRLPTFLYQMYESGTGPGLTQRACAAAFSEVAFLPRAAVEFKDRVQSTTLLGHPIDIPVVLQPVGALRTGRPGEGELAAARAAGAAGTIVTVSSFTGYAIEDVTRAATGPVFFQLFILGGRANTEHMIRRAKAAGCRALVVTVDIAAPGGRRERAYRDRVYTPGGTTIRDALMTCPQLVGHLPWLRAFIKDGRPLNAPMFLDATGRPVPVAEGVARQLERIPTWEDLDWIREIWDGPIVLKGILAVDDAKRARDAGVEAIIVSNHGGNHLDGGVPSLHMLPAIVAAVGADLEIILDGGVRRGSDVVKAIALGANAVGIGRGYVYPLLAAGERGVRRILEVFRDEIDEILASVGCGDIENLDPSFLRLPVGWPATA